MQIRISNITNIQSSREPLHAAAREYLSYCVRKDHLKDLEVPTTLSQVSPAAQLQEGVLISTA